MKIISFSQQVSRAICILAANGAISNVTLRQSNSSGGTLTYEVKSCFFYTEFHMVMYVEEIVFSFFVLLSTGVF